MTAHDETRDPSREGAVPGAGPASGSGLEPSHEPASESSRKPPHEPEYDGMDALMAAILDEPLPEPARRDPVFMAARDAAAADLAVLRERLTAIGDALAGPRDGVPAGRDAAARPGKRPDPDAGPEQDTGTRPPADRTPAPENPPAPAAPAPLKGPRSRSGEGPGPGARPRTAGGPHRPRRRTAKAVFGGLVAAAAAGLVLGTGWLVTQGGGTADSTAGGAAVDSKEEAGVAFGSPRYLACARLVAEGRVTAVEQVPGAAGVQRVTLEVSRYYKGGGEVTFLRDAASGGPPPREGDQVLIGMPAGGAHPDAVVAGEPDITRERARIIASLPESRTLTCG